MRFPTQPLRVPDPPGTLRWLGKSVLGAYTPLEQCSQDCYLKYGAQSANVDADKLVACFVQCDVANAQPQVAPPGGIIVPGGFTLPGGFTIPAAWPFPPGVIPSNWPASWKLPPGWNIPGLPAGAPNLPAGWQFPAGWTLPTSWTLPGDWKLPVAWVIPEGTSLPPAPTPLQCPQGQIWDGVKCVTPGASSPSPVTTTAPASTDNTIWWVIGGVIVLGAVALIVSGAGGGATVPQLEENPSPR